MKGKMTMEIFYQFGEYSKFCVIAPFIIGVICAIKKNEEGSNTCANLAVAIGVLGTFIGISEGLSEFDVNEIQNSIPPMLEGMKLAFSTSILGMVSSIFIKIIHSVSTFIYNVKQNEVDTDIDNIDDLFNAMLREMKDLNGRLQLNQRQTEDVFLELGRAFENNQHKLNEELRSLNQSLNNKQDMLIKEFRAFGETMAHNNTQALVEVLEQVIRDFNNNLTEQFGENFKELNVAVSKLLDWQEYYKNTVELTTNQLKVTVDSIKSIDKSLLQIENSSTSLIQTSESINSTLKMVEYTQQDVKNGMVSIIDISEKAKESIPNLNNYFESTNNYLLKSIDSLDESLDEKIISINKYIADLTQIVSDSSKQSINEITNNINQNSMLLTANAKEYIKELESLTLEIKNTIPGISDDINKNYSVFKETLEAFTENINIVLNLNKEQTMAQCEVLSKTNADLREKLQLQIESIHEETSKQIVKIVEQMEKLFLDRSNQVSDMLEYELKESLNSLGTQLATLSGRFVEDYAPLTERLRDIVKIAQGV